MRVLYATYCGVILRRLSVGVFLLGVRDTFLVPTLSNNSIVGMISILLHVLISSSWRATKPCLMATSSLCGRHRITVTVVATLHPLWKSAKTWIVTTMSSMRPRTMHDELQARHGHLITSCKNLKLIIINSYWTKEGKELRKKRYSAVRNLYQNYHPSGMYVHLTHDKIYYHSGQASRHAHTSTILFCSYIAKIKTREVVFFLLRNRYFLLLVFFV
mmetsp:Transcript_38526/g.42606  ORF Transcript_38526/g.42606 Transcript_38526/m.42606 type:complete len:216 (+) Transcript_38526:728-1375(+)